MTYKLLSTKAIRSVLFASLFGSSFLLSGCGATDTSPRVVLTAAEADIPAGLVLVDIPEEMRGEVVYELVPDGGGEPLPAQAWDEAQAAFLLPERLPAGESKEYSIHPAEASGEHGVEVFEDRGQLQVTSEGGPIMIYQSEVVMPPEGSPEYYKRGGFIHPVYSPSGKILTDDFPVGHTHQHALFMAWVNTTFHGEKVDFWNQQDNSGTVEHRKILETENGPVFGRFKVEHAYVSTKFGDALTEVWTVTAYAEGDDIIFDIRSDQKAASDEPLHLNEYHYGGMAFRGSAQWNVEDETAFQSPMQALTSEGKGVEEGNHTRPRWTAGYGPVDDGIAGLAILSHPDNFRAPQPVRIHPSMPYFCWTPMVEGAFDISPGETYSSSYRFVSFDGEPDADHLEELWENYANPPKAGLP